MQVGEVHIQQLNDLLREVVGLNPEATPGVTEMAIQNILQERPDVHPAQYVELVRTSQEELDALLESVLVPETWFFRYPDAYEYLQNWVLSKWMPQHPGARLKILSIPCSTGEEPYSIGIALSEAGLSKDHFSITAADISARAIRRAVAALYSEHSFREPVSRIRNRYFVMQADQFHLNSSITSTVRFYQWNVQRPPPVEIAGPFDIIFCRNLFIYFHTKAQKRMVETLKRLLSDDGLLFAGHAEAGHLLSPAFKAIPPLKAFVHHKS